MAFVRKKRGLHRDYYQLVESYRPEGVGTPRQRVLFHLGEHPTVDDALKKWPREIKRLRANEEEGTTKRADALEEKLHRLTEYKKRGVVTR